MSLVQDMFYEKKIYKIFTSSNVLLAIANKISQAWATFRPLQTIFLTFPVLILHYSA